MAWVIPVERRLAGAYACSGMFRTLASTRSFSAMRWQRRRQVVQFVCLLDEGGKEEGCELGDLAFEALQGLSDFPAASQLSLKLCRAGLHRRLLAGQVLKVSAQSLDVRILRRHYLDGLPDFLNGGRLLVQPRDGFRCFRSSRLREPLYRRAVRDSPFKQRVVPNPRYRPGHAPAARHARSRRVGPEDSVARRGRRRACLDSHRDWPATHACFPPVVP
jgi:hypothetical protein